MWLDCADIEEGKLGHREESGKVLLKLKRGTNPCSQASGALLPADRNMCTHGAEKNRSTFVHNMDKSHSPAKF